MADAEPLLETVHSNVECDDTNSVNTDSDVGPDVGDEYDSQGHRNVGPYFQSEASPTTFFGSLGSCPRYVAQLFFNSVFYQEIVQPRLPKGFGGWLYFVLNMVYSLLAAFTFAALSYLSKEWNGGALGASASASMNIPMSYDFTRRFLAFMKKIPGSDWLSRLMFVVALIFACFTTFASLALTEDAIAGIPFCEDWSEEWVDFFVAFAAFNTLCTRFVGAAGFLLGIFCPLKPKDDNEKVLHEVLKDLRGVRTYSKALPLTAQGVVGWTQRFYEEYQSAPRWQRHLKTVVGGSISLFFLLLSLLSAPVFMEKSRQGVQRLGISSPVLDSDGFALVCMLSSVFFYLYSSYGSGRKFVDRLLNIVDLARDSSRGTFQRILGPIGLLMIIAAGFISGAGMGREQRGVINANYTHSPWAKVMGDFIGHYLAAETSVYFMMSAAGWVNLIAFFAWMTEQVSVVKDIHAYEKRSQYDSDNTNSMNESMMVNEQTLLIAKKKPIGVEDVRRYLENQIRAHSVEFYAGENNSNEIMSDALTHIDKMQSARENSKLVKSRQDESSFPRLLVQCLRSTGVRCCTLFRCSGVQGAQKGQVQYNQEFNQNDIALQNPGSEALLPGDSVVQGDDDEQGTGFTNLSRL